MASKFYTHSLLWAIPLYLLLCHLDLDLLNFSYDPKFPSMDPCKSTHVGPTVVLE